MTKIPEGFPPETQVFSITINLSKPMFQIIVAAWTVAIRYWKSTDSAVSDDVSDALSKIAEYFARQNPNARLIFDDDQNPFKLDEPAAAEVRELVDKFREFRAGRNDSYADSVQEFFSVLNPVYEIVPTAPKFHNLLLAKAFNYLFDGSANYKLPESPCKLATGAGGKSGNITTYFYIKPNGADHLDAIDKRIYNALDSIWVDQAGSKNRGYCTMRQLLEYARLSDRPSNRRLVLDSLARMDKYEIWIDDHEELEQRGKKAMLERWKGRLLQYKIVPVMVNGRTYEQGIEFLQPIFSQYARAHGKELTTVEIMVLDSPGKNTLVNVALKNYTMEYLSRCWNTRADARAKLAKLQHSEKPEDLAEVERLKKKASADVTITFEYLYNLTNACNKLQKKRTRDSAESILKYYENQGLLHVKAVSKGENGFKIVFEDPAEIPEQGR